MEWKTIRITKDAWKVAKRAIAGEDVDLDDFLSFLIEESDLSDVLSGYLEVLEEEDGDGEEDEKTESTEAEEHQDIAYDPKMNGKTRKIKGGSY